MNGFALFAGMLILTGCAVESSDAREPLISEIETCLERASQARTLTNEEARAAVGSCSTEMNAYSRFSMEKMFSRRFDTTDSEMMELYAVHQSALRTFAIKKLTTGEGDWQ